MQINRELNAAALPDGPARAEALLAVLLISLAIMAFGNLALLASTRLDEPSYDFRYFWLAGKLWFDGVSPYGPAFQEAGARLITEGHVPEIWPYPPNLWLPTIWLAFFNLETASRIWTVLSVLAVPLASAVLASVAPLSRIPNVLVGSIRLGRPALFGLHLLLMCKIEFTQLAIFFGQISIFIYLGAALLWSGLAGQRRGYALAGLVLLFLKPQVGLIVGLGLLFASSETRRLVLLAVLVSIGTMLPAIVLRPLVLVDWLQTLAQYDGISFANLPIAMSGLRHLFWVHLGVDTGNMAAMAVAIAAGLVAAVVLRGRCTGRGRESGLMLANTAAVELLVATAFAPLHIYDFVAIGPAFLAFLQLRRLPLGIGLAGLALTFRPSDLKIWLEDGGPVTLFPGTTIATWGIMLLLVALLMQVIRSTRTV